MRCTWTQCLQLHDILPLPLRQEGIHNDGRPHCIWCIHGHSYIGSHFLTICVSKSGSCWMNQSSCWQTAAWLQFLLRQYLLIVDCCNLFSCNWAVVLCACWQVTIIVEITVIMIVKWDWQLCIQWPSNIDCCVGCHIRHLLLRDKDNTNQRYHKACAGGPLHLQESVVHGTWCHFYFSSSPRPTFGMRVNMSDQRSESLSLNID